MKGKKQKINEIKNNKEIEILLKEADITIEQLLKVSEIFAEIVIKVDESDITN